MMHSKIFIMFLLFNSFYSYDLFEFKNVQPNGTTNYNIILKSSRDDFLSIKFFKKTYKRHTNFALEKKKANPDLRFGEIFSFSPHSHCNNEYNKNIAIQCLQNRPSNWWCIYDACISPSKPTFHYVKITLPPLYKDNNFTKMCEII